MVLALCPFHVRQDLRVDEGEGVDAVEVVQVVPLVKGHLVVVEHVGEGGHQTEHILKECLQKKDESDEYRSILTSSSSLFQVSKVEEIQMGLASGFTRTHFFFIFQQKGCARARVRVLVQSVGLVFLFSHFEEYFFSFFFLSRPKRARRSTTYRT